MGSPPLVALKANCCAPACVGTAQQRRSEPRLAAAAKAACNFTSPHRSISPFTQSQFHHQPASQPASLVDKLLMTLFNPLSARVVTAHLHQNSKDFNFYFIFIPSTRYILYCVHVLRGPSTKFLQKLFQTAVSLALYQLLAACARERESRQN